MPTFDVLTERWIPVVRMDGTPDDVGLREALLSAPDIREIRDPMPTVEFGLYRLLVAVAMDIHRIGKRRDLEALLGKHAFDAAKAEDYFAECGHCFDLFSEDHPFLQTPGVPAKETTTVARLLPPVPTGINVTHFHHDPDTFAVCPHVAARLLTALAPFAYSEGSKPPPGFSPSINGAPPWYVLVIGRSLFETVCLNCYAGHLPQADGAEPPAWRGGRPVTLRNATSASPLEALTWRPRQVQLVPDEVGGKCSMTGGEAAVLVRHTKYLPGMSWYAPKEKSKRDLDVDPWVDPNIAYSINVNGIRGIRPTEGRELWRDIGALALLGEGNHGKGGDQVRFERPLVVDQFARLVDSGTLPLTKELHLVAYGLRTGKSAKVSEWQREVLPPLLGWRSPGRHRAQAAMKDADDLAQALRIAVEFAHSRPGKHSYTSTGPVSIDKAAFDEWKRLRRSRPRNVEARSLALHAERRFWADLRPHYDEFLHGLAGLPEDAQDSAAEQCLERWRAQLHQVGRQALDEAIGDLDTDADALVRQVNARSFFRRRLHKLLSAGSGTEAADRKAPTRRLTGGDER